MKCKGQIKIKISTIIDSINNGQVIFTDNNKDAIQQILDFRDRNIQSMMTLWMLLLNV
jgi:CBS domain containing-hemolysin-like protein